MRIPFKTLAVTAALVCFALAVVWLVVPGLLPTIWGVEYSYPVGLLARRSAALFLGIGTMFLLARNARASQGRLALMSGFAVGCCALAALGVFEFIAGHAGAGIFSAILVEVALAVLFLAAARNEAMLLKTTLASPDLAE